MLNISCLDEFRSHIAHKEEIREANIGDDCISFCYIVSSDSTFDDAWSRECRGIVFDKTSGRVIGRPLHKFFNVGERESTRVENLDWSKVVRVADKRDGCLGGNTVLITSDGEKTIKDICEQKYNGLVLGWNHHLSEKCWTPILGHSVKPNNNDWYELVFENGKLLKLTGNHKVYSKTRQCYVRVDELTLDDEIQEID